MLLVSVGVLVYVGIARAIHTLTLTLVLTTGLITIFILVISVIGKWSVVCARANTNIHQPLTVKIPI